MSSIHNVIIVMNIQSIYMRVFEENMRNFFVNNYKAIVIVIILFIIIIFLLIMNSASKEDGLYTINFPVQIVEIDDEYVYVRLLSIFPLSTSSDDNQLLLRTCDFSYIVNLNNERIDYSDIEEGGFLRIEATVYESQFENLGTLETIISLVYSKRLEGLLK